MAIDTSPWHCLYCTKRLSRQLHERVLADLWREAPAGTRSITLILVCGRCRGLHIVSDGAPRKPTSAERFQIEIEQGRALEVARALPPDAPTQVIAEAGD